MPGKRASETSSTGRPARMPRISRSFPAVVVASRRLRMPPRRPCGLTLRHKGHKDHEDHKDPGGLRVSSWSSFRSVSPWRVSLLQVAADDLALLLDQRLDAFVREAHQRVERAAIEGLSFGGALQLDEAAVARLHEVHVDLGLRILLVGQVEQSRAADDSD